MGIEQQVFEAGKYLYEQMEQLGGMSVSTMHQECLELGQRSFTAFLEGGRKTPMQLAQHRLSKIKKKAEQKR